MATKTVVTKRITKKVSLPSPSLQSFLKSVLTNDEAYLKFLEDTPGALRSQGLELGDDVTPALLSDFRFAMDRARNSIKQSAGRLSFEDVFQIPIISIDNGRIHVGPVRAVAADTTVDVYYSEKSSSENRGSKTDFSSGMTPTKSTDRWSTKNFGGSSVFPGDIWKERFDRSPMVAAQVLTRIIKAIK